MGIAGHILGEKKLRQLRQRTGLDLDRAYIRNGYCEGRTVGDEHYDIDPQTGVAEKITQPVHWMSCRDMEAQP